MEIEKMAVMSISGLSDETQEVLMDMASHEHSISCVEAREGFIVNISEMPGGKDCDTEMPDLDEILKKVKEEDCSWIFFREY